MCPLECRNPTQLIAWLCERLSKVQAVSLYGTSIVETGTSEILAFSGSYLCLWLCWLRMHLSILTRLGVDNFFSICDFLVRSTIYLKHFSQILFPLEVSLLLLFLPLALLCFSGSPVPGFSSLQIIFMH